MFNLNKILKPLSKKLSKRQFIAFTGTVAAGLGISSCSQGSKNQNSFDAIIVGAGNTGLPAAIFAAQRGAKVLMIEAASVMGGTLLLSTGQMSAAGTKLQKSKGIEDSPQSHYDDVMRISKGTADPDILKMATFNAADTFDWLTDNGFEVKEGHPVTGTTHEPYSRARYAWGAEGGISILKVLEEQIQPHIDSGLVTIKYNTEAKELIQDESGQVTGLVTTDFDGKTEKHFGKNVLLTCGGYASNPVMFEELEGAIDYSDVSYPYSQGIGITLGQSVGGYVRYGEHHLPLFGAILAGDTYPSPMAGMARHFPPERPPWEILVDVSGKRFLKEDIPSHDAYEHALRDCPEETCWAVFDQEIFDNAPPLISGTFGSGPLTQQDVADAFNEERPKHYKSDTLEDLAEIAGINKENFIKTVSEYNKGQASGKDELGRVHMPLPIAKAPFYAVKLQSWLLTSYAGLAVNKQLQVIRQDGSAVKGLYAAGELLGTGATCGRSVCGGMLVTPALTLGRLLGQEIIEFET